MFDTTDIWINEIYNIFLQIKRELVYILTSPLYKENYITIILRNLTHLPISAYSIKIKGKSKGTLTNF